MTGQIHDDEATLIRPLTLPPRQAPLLEAVVPVAQYVEALLKLVENEVVKQVVAPAALAFALIYTAVGSVLLCVLCSR